MTKILQTLAVILTIIFFYIVKQIDLPTDIKIVSVWLVALLTASSFVFSIHFKNKVVYWCCIVAILILVNIVYSG